MQIKKLLPLALATAASAQDMMNNTLAAALSSSPELSSLAATLASVPGLAEAVAGLTNVTILAPSNAAFEELMNNTDAAAALAEPGVIQAILGYHVLNGTYYAENVTETPTFIPTSLMNSSFTNVTGGQVVEAVMMDDMVIFRSGLFMNSTVTTAVSYLKLFHLLNPSDPQRRM